LAEALKSKKSLHDIFDTPYLIKCFTFVENETYLPKKSLEMPMNKGKNEGGCAAECEVLT
jgi:hypothetical protein